MVCSCSDSSSLLFFVHLYVCTLLFPTPPFLLCVCVCAFTSATVLTPTDCSSVSHLRLLPLPLPSSVRPALMPSPTPTLLRASFPAWNSTSLLLLLPPVLCNGLLLALFPLHDIDPIPKRTTHKEIETGGKHIANWRWGLGLFLSPLFFAPAIVEPIMQICVISTVQCITK